MPKKNKGKKRPLPKPIPPPTLATPPQTPPHLPDWVGLLIKGIKLVFEGFELWLKHHLKLAVFVGVLVLALVLVIRLTRSQNSDCLEIEAHLIGKVSVDCTHREPQLQETTEGRNSKTYTDVEAGFALRLEDPNDWSVVQAENFIDASGPAKAFRFPRGLLRNQDVTVLTKDGTVAFIYTKTSGEGKPSLWVFHIREQLRVEELVAQETNQMLRAAGAVGAYVMSSVSLNAYSPRRLSSPERGNPVELTKEDGFS